MERKADPLVLTRQTRQIRFLQEFIKTGNATESAWRIFNCTTRASAQALGSYCLKISKPLVRSYFDKHGYSYGWFLDIAIKKMEESKKPEWWDRLMKIAGYPVQDFVL